MTGSSGRQSAVDLWFPPLDDVIGEWHQAHVPVAKYGVAPHLSLLYPWLPAPVRSEAVARLRGALGDMAPFTLSFRALRRFPGVLWLAPAPRDAVMALSRRLTAAFPDVKAYGGQFGVPEPHLTVAKGSGDVLDEVERALGARLDETGPLVVRVDRVSVVEQDERGHWHVRHELPLTPA